MKYLMLVALAACGPPVQGRWEALNINLDGYTLDLSQEFTDRNLTSKAVTYIGSTAVFTTVFSGTYTWENKNDGTHVHTSYSSAQITGPQGNIQPLDTVCTSMGNCEGYQFKSDPASPQTICFCKRQELVFRFNGDTMLSTYADVPVTYRHPPK